MKPYTVITIGYMLLITLLSHVPQEDLPKSDLDSIDYLFHFAEYSILGFLLFRSITSDELLTFHPFYGSLLIGIFFAILDEFHQSLQQYSLFRSKSVQIFQGDNILGLIL